MTIIALFQHCSYTQNNLILYMRVLLVKARLPVRFMFNTNIIHTSTTDCNRHLTKALIMTVAYWRTWFLDHGQ